MTATDTRAPRPSRIAHAKPRSCDGKQRLGAKRARRAARVLRDSGDAVHPYPCQHCGSWHVGADWDRA